MMIWKRRCMYSLVRARCNSEKTFSPSPRAFLSEKRKKYRDIKEFEFFFALCSSCLLQGDRESGSAIERETVLFRRGAATGVPFHVGGKPARPDWFSPPHFDLETLGLVITGPHHQQGTIWQQQTGGQARRASAGRTQRHAQPCYLLADPQREPWMFDKARYIQGGPSLLTHRQRIIEREVRERVTRSVLVERHEEGGGGQKRAVQRSMRVLLQAIQRRCRAQRQREAPDENATLDKLRSPCLRDGRRSPGGDDAIIGRIFRIAGESIGHDGLDPGPRAETRACLFHQFSRDIHRDHLPMGSD